MAVDDDILVKNPFGFQLAGVLVNDAVTREAVTKEQMRKFLKFVYDDVVYCQYYEVVYILFHTGVRISEFCGLTLKDIDLQNKTMNIDHQLQRTSDMRYIIENTKTDAGTRVLPITEDVAQMFQAIIEDRNAPKVEKSIDGYSGFLFYDDNGMPFVAMHWQHRFNHMVGRYNDIYRMINQKWVTDVSEFKYGVGEDDKKGKLYLSVILDLCDRRPVAFVYSTRNDNPLVFDTFDKAVAANPGATPLLHSDRGYQYTSKAFRRRILAAGMTQSMSRVARCIDNGPMEGFWGLMKREMYYGKKYKTKEELMLAIEKYIDYYTNKRVQRNLGVLTPLEFHEQKLENVA